MDLHIQSLVQSSIYNEVSDKVKTNINPYVHSIPHNEVITSKSQTTVYSSDPYNALPSRTVEFEIPRRGKLHRLLLNLRVRSDRTTDADGTVTSLSSPVNSLLHFQEVFVRADLICDNRVIESLYPGSIISALSPYQNTSVYSSIEAGLRGYGGTPDVGAAWNNKGFTTDNWTDYEMSQFYGYDGMDSFKNHQLISNLFIAEMDFAIPLHFSFADKLSTSLDTNLMKKMKVLVVLKNHGVIQHQNNSPNPRTFAFMRCFYHNIIQNLSNNIRNENFKKHEPLSLITRNSRIFDQVLYRSDLIGTETTSTIRIDMTSNHFAKDIFIHFKRQKKPEPSAGWGARPEFVYVPKNTMVRLFGNNRVIFSASVFEIEQQAFTSRGSSMMDSKTDFTIDYGTLVQESDAPSTTTYGPLVSHFVHIPFSMFNSPDFCDGGLNFKTLVNPYLELEMVDMENVYTSDTMENVSFAYTYQSVMPVVCMNYRTISRQNGDTGDWTVQHAF